MPEETERKASSPPVGAMRDAVRTLIGFIIAFGLVKLFGEDKAAELAGVSEGLVVIITSAILAFVGKAMRNDGMSAGKII